MMGPHGNPVFVQLNTGRVFGHYDPLGYCKKKHVARAAAANLAAGEGGAPPRRPRLRSPPWRAHPWGMGSRPRTEATAMRAPT